MTDPMAQPQVYSPNELARWADLIADGRDAFPSRLADPDRSAPEDLVRVRLRERLIRHIARAIANWHARKE